jgi:hypothetical protein
VFDEVQFVPADFGQGNAERGKFRIKIGCAFFATFFVQAKKVKQTPNNIYLSLRCIQHDQQSTVNH